MPGCRHHGIIDRDDRKPANAQALGLHCVELGDFFFERAARERHPEHGLLERARFLVLEATRAAVLTLVVAPDAVVGVVERGRQIHAGIGERETIARAHVLRPEAEHGDAVLDRRLNGNEMRHLELVRHLEEHAAAMSRLPLRRERRPGCIARGEVERRPMLGLRRHPARDMRGVIGLGQSLAHQSLELAPERGTIERRGFFGRHALDGATLHEEALHLIERRQRMMTRLERAHLSLDPEEIADEILEMRREVDQQLRVHLGLERVGIAPRRHQPVVQIRIGRAEPCDERRIETHEPVAAVQILEGEIVLELEFADGHPRVQIESACAPKDAAPRSSSINPKPRRLYMILPPLCYARIAA